MISDLKIFDKITCNMKFSFPQHILNGINERYVLITK